jgi:hypothetical protein
VRDSVGGVAQDSLNIVVRQTRVRVKEVGLRRPLRQLAKDALDRNAGAPHHGLALKDGGFDLDPVGRHGDAQLSVGPGVDQSAHVARRVGDSGNRLASVAPAVVVRISERAAGHNE